MSRRADILKHIRDTLAALPVLHADRVHIGRLNPQRLSMQPSVLIQPESDRAQRSDCDRTTRTFDLVVGVVVRMDPVSNDEQVLQIEEAYESVHSALEGLMQDACGGLVMAMDEGDSGIVPGGLDDLDHLAYIACDWRLVYERDLVSET